MLNVVLLFFCDVHVLLVFYVMVKKDQSILSIDTFKKDKRAVIALQVLELP